jgi:hypothetical protein
MKKDTQILINQLRADAACRGARVDPRSREDFSTWRNPSRHAVDRLDAQIGRWSNALMAGGHFDAGESAVLSRQLLYIKTREANILYPSLLSRKFIPVSNEIPSGAEQFSIKIWDIVGQAKIIANYAQDFPSVNTFVNEVIAPIRSIGDSYTYTIQDLRAASMVPGLSIDMRRADVARMVHERKVDDIAAFGSTQTGLASFAKNSNIGLTSIVGSWASAESSVILGDMNAIAQAVVTQSVQIWTPDTMLLPTAAWGIVATRPYSTLNPTTILEVFLRNSPYIKNVDQWNKLNAANASGNGGRIVTYVRDPMCVELEIPQEFEQMPPQLEGMQYKVPCHSRCGGVSWHYPISATYADGAV